MVATSLAVYGILAKKNTYLVTFNSKNIAQDNNYGLNKLKGSFWDIYPQLVIASDGMQLDKNIVVKDAKNNEYSLSQLVGNKSKLVFRYSVRDCDICIDSVFYILNRYKENKGLSDVIILTDSYSERDFILKMKYTESPFVVYDISPKGLSLALENRNLPFLFLLGKDFRAVKFFTPFKELSGKTDEYLDIVLRQLKEENYNE